MTTAELSPLALEWAAVRLEDELEDGQSAASIRAARAKLDKQEAEIARLREALEEIASYDDGPMAGVAYTAKIALATDQKGGEHEPR